MKQLPNFSRIEFTPADIDHVINEECEKADLDFEDLVHEYGSEDAIKVAKAVIDTYQAAINKAKASV